MKRNSEIIKFKFIIPIIILAIVLGIVFIINKINGKNDAYSYVTLPNDTKAYTTAEFQSSFVMKQITKRRNFMNENKATINCDIAINVNRAVSIEISNFL